MADIPKRRFSFLQRYPLLGPVAGLFFVLILFEVMVPLKRAGGIGPLLDDFRADDFSTFVDKYNFLAPYTIGLILTQTVIVAIGALGMTLIIVTGGIDLSAGSVVAICGVLAGMTLRDGAEGFLANFHYLEKYVVLIGAGMAAAHFSINKASAGTKRINVAKTGAIALVGSGVGIWVLLFILGAILVRLPPSLAAVMVAILVGVAVGLINGGIIARFRLLPFIVTLGMMSIARGLSKLLAHDENVNYTMDSTSGVNALMNNPHTIAPGDVSGATYHMLSWFMGPDPNPASNGALLVPVWLPPVGVLILLMLTIVMSFVLNRSVFGRHIFALGSNEDTARLCGLRTGWLKVAVYAVGGIFIGLAGIMQLARLAQGDPTVAVGLELQIIAAVVIGGTSLNGGVGSIWGSVVGAIMMTALSAGTVQMRWPSDVQEVIIGIVLILAHGLDKLRERGFKG